MSSSPDQFAGSENYPERLGVHDHVCLLYETGAEQFATIVPFIRIGLERGEKCIYFADDNSVETVLDALSGGGIDVETAQSSGALLIATKWDSYLRNRRFDPEEMLAFVANAVTQSEAEGFTAVRGAAEMTWALGDEPGVELLMEYESRINHLFATHRALAICQYNLARFSPKMIRDAILTHPLVICRDMLCQNFYYVPPEEYLCQGNDSYGVERLMMNIVEREQVLRSLRKSEANYRQVLDTVQEGIWGIDKDAITTFVNPHMAEILGYTPAEMIGKHLFSFMDEQGKLIAVQNIARRKQGIKEQHDFEFIAKNGERVYTRLETGPILDADGMYNGAIAAVADITERRRSEELLREKKERLNAMALDLSLAEERERRAIASELHDHIGQNLSLARIKLGMLARHITGENPGLLLDEARSILDSVIHDVRAITHRVSPPILESGSLEAALKWLGRQIESDYGLQVQFVDDMCDKPLSEEARSVLYHAVRELLINVVKHARAASVTVSVGRNDEALQVTVADDGIGFDYSGINENGVIGNGYGLFNVRRRICHFGGAFQIESSVGKGSRVSMVMPLDALQTIPLKEKQHVYQSTSC